MSVSSFNKKAIRDSKSKRKYKRLVPEIPDPIVRIYNGKADPVTLYKNFSERWKKLNFLGFRKNFKIVNKEKNEENDLKILLKMKNMLKPIHFKFINENPNQKVINKSLKIEDVN